MPGGGRYNGLEGCRRDMSLRYDAPMAAGDDDDIAVIEIEDAIDLHGFQPRDILSVVDSYLEAAHDKGLREVRLIHGRGKGVQRHNVQRLLADNPLVEDFDDAPAYRGGWGATIVWLKD